MKYNVKIIFIKQNCEKSEYFVYSTVYFFSVQRLRTEQFSTNSIMMLKKSECQMYT